MSRLLSGENQNRKTADSLTAVLKDFLISQSHTGIEDGIFFSFKAFTVLAFHDVFIYVRNKEKGELTKGSSEVLRK